MIVEGGRKVDCDRIEHFSVPPHCNVDKAASGEGGGNGSRLARVKNADRHAVWEAAEDFLKLVGRQRFGPHD